MLQSFGSILLVRRGPEAFPTLRPDEHRLGIGGSGLAPMLVAGAFGVNRMLHTIHVHCLSDDFIVCLHLLISLSRSLGAVFNPLVRNCNDVHGQSAKFQNPVNQIGYYSVRRIRSPTGSMCRRETEGVTTIKSPEKHVRDTKKEKTTIGAIMSVSDERKGGGMCVCAQCRRERQ